MNANEVIEWTFILLISGVFFALLITLPQVVAAWAVINSRAVPGRLLAALGLWGLYGLIFQALGGLPVAAVVGMGMLAVAVPLWLVRLRRDGRLQFTLRGLFLTVTGIALLLGLCIRISVALDPDDLKIIVVYSLFPATTLVAIWVAVSRRPRYQRATLLGAWLVVGTVTIVGLTTRFDVWEAYLWSVVALAWHALLAIGIIRLWMREQSHRSEYQHVLQHVGGREPYQEPITSSYDLPPGRMQAPSMPGVPPPPPM